MNWYKEIKIALPVNVSLPIHNYMEIGHEGYWDIGDVDGIALKRLEPEAQKSVKRKIESNKETLWIMDDKYKITEHPSVGINENGVVKRYSHFDVWGLLPDKTIAKGRYEGDNNIVSFGFTAYYRDHMLSIPFHRRSYAENMVFKAVDKHFGNPEIAIFN